MKLALALLAAAAALPAFARSYQTFHSSFNSYNLQADGMNNGGYISDVPAATDFSAPVGSGTFRHSGAPVADGSHAFSSFSDVEISISFDIGGTIYSFDQSHIISDTSALDVHIANGAFHFGGSDTTTVVLPDSEMTLYGSIFFRNGDDVLGMTYDDRDSYGYMLFQPTSPNPLAWSVPAQGLYGTAETAYFGSAIPEPSSFAALAGLGALALTVARRRRAA